MSNPIEDLIEQMPAPSEFSEQITAPTAGEDSRDSAPSVEPIAPTPIDTAPVEPQSDDVFNPDIHESGPDGKGILRKDGKGYRRKRGRKTGSVATGVGATQPAQSPDQRLISARHAAQVSMACTFVLGQIILGPDGAPIVDPQKGINEPGEFQSAYEQFYLLSEKPINIPPWMLVGLVTTSYLARRMQMEQPRSRVQKVWGWIRNRAVDVYCWWKGYKQ